MGSGVLACVPREQREDLVLQAAEPHRWPLTGSVREALTKYRQIGWLVNKESVLLTVLEAAG